jgi:hypothetical protein
LLRLWRLAVLHLLLEVWSGLRVAVLVPDRGRSRGRRGAGAVKVVELNGRRPVPPGPVLEQHPVAGVDERPRRDRGRRAEAMGYAATAVAAGDELSGKELGERFGMSARWGRDILREVGGAAGSRVAAATAVAAPPADVAVRRVTTLAVLVVAAVAAVISYEHMRALAAAAGEEWRASLVPVSVDGLMVAASMTALTRRRAGQAVGALAWVALGLGIAASVTANVAAAEPTMVGRAVAAWPPVALGLSFELLLQQGRHRND